MAYIFDRYFATGVSDKKNISDSLGFFSYLFNTHLF